MRTVRDIPGPKPAEDDSWWTDEIDDRMSAIFRDDEQDLSARTLFQQDGRKYLELG